MSGITTHVLDVSIGAPAAGITVALERQKPNVGWEEMGIQATDSDGRARGLVVDGQAITPGVYRLKFDVRAYFEERNVEAFYPDIAIAFVVADPSQHYHVPLLLSPFGYTTYRGS